MTQSEQDEIRALRTELAAFDAVEAEESSDHPRPASRVAAGESIHFLRAGIIFKYKEKAFASLEKACTERDFQLTDLKVEPAYDSLRDDPRFQDLMRRVGFPQ